MEVVLRGVGASVLGNMVNIQQYFLLIIGMIVENIKYLRINTLSVIYFVSLLPAIALLPDVPLIFASNDIR